MLTVIYDAVNGDPVADGLAEKYAMHHCTQGSTEVKVCNSIAVDAFRVMVVRGVIAHTDIQFKYEGEIIPVENNAWLKLWPKGFCDHTRNFLCEIMKSRRK